jgi:glycosyltransferase involved in cell wall biosynthesis
MVKVLIVAASYPYPEHRDGLAKINANLIVDNPYYEADMLCVQDVDCAELQRCRIFKVPRRAPGPKLFNIASYLLFGKPLGVVKIQGYIRAFRDFILEHHQRYDIIHISSPYLAEVVDGLPTAIASKLLIFPIDSMALFWQRRTNAERSLLKRLIYRMELWRCIRFERRYYPKFKTAIFVSDVDRCAATKLDSESDFQSIPNGVDLEYFTPSNLISRATNSLVFTGDMSYAPNRDAALFLAEEILPRIDPRLNVHLFLVGQRPDDQLKSLESAQITVTGFVDDLRPYLSAASMYVSPLRMGSGIKNKVLEAMSLQMVVLGTKLSFEGIECVAGRDCLQISSDPKAFAEQIEVVLLNPDEFRPLALRARSLIEEKYSWDSIRNAYGRLYENCVGDR